MMLAVTPQMRILVAAEPVDFRCGIDGLARICRKQLQSDPFTGTVFVFRNKDLTSIKCLAYDGQGFVLYLKRLSSGRFRHWPDGKDGAVASMLAHEVHVLLCGGNPSATGALAPWSPLPALG